MGNRPRSKGNRKRVKRNYYKLSNPPKLRTKRKVVSNPFFNFLRDFRRQNSTLSVTEIATKGAKRWHKMSEEERRKYYRTSACAPSTYKAKRHKRRRNKDKDKKFKSKSKSASKSKSKSKSKTRSKTGSSEE